MCPYTFGYLGKDSSLREEPTPHQLVGKVMAYQGYDG